MSVCVCGGVRGAGLWEGKRASLYLTQGHKVTERQRWDQTPGQAPPDLRPRASTTLSSPPPRKLLICPANDLFSLSLFS